MSGFSRVKESKTTQAALFIFLFLVIFSRAYLETAVFVEKPFFSYFVAAHHCCWFAFVFFWFAACARYILGLRPDKIPFLALLSPVIFIPLLHSWITGTPLKLQYLRGDLSKALSDMFTFYWFSEKDTQFFYEMVTLFIAFAVLSWLISRNILRTLLNILIGFYGSMFIAGLQLFGVAPRTKAYFPIHTSFKNHFLLSLIYFTAVLIIFSICWLPEIRDEFLKNRKRHIVLFLSGIAASMLILFTVSFRIRQLSAADFILLTVPITTLFVSAGSITKGCGKVPGGRFFPLLFSAFSLVLLLGAVFLRTKAFIH